MLTRAGDSQAADFLIQLSKYEEACDGGGDWGSIRFHFDGFASVFAAMWILTRFDACWLWR